VQDLYRAAGNGVGSLLGPVVRERGVAGDRAGRRSDGLLRDVSGRRSAVEGVELVLREVLEGVNVGLQVLAEHLDRVPEEQLGHQEGTVLGEVPLVEHEQELGSLFEGLDTVWDTSWEEPHVTG